MLIILNIYSYVSLLCLLSLDINVLASNVSLRMIVGTQVTVVVSHSKEYRSDYEYNRKTDAFYKLHTESMEYELAKEICEAESAKLMMPSQRDIIQAHGMLKQFPDIGDYIWAADDGLSHESGEDYEARGVLISSSFQHFLDGNTETYTEPACEVITREGQVYKLHCLDSYPFICKVEAKDAPYDRQCDVFSRGYQYLESIGSCYKISSAVLSWNQAYEECQAESAHLLVLNSEQEHQAVHNLTHFAPKMSERVHSPYYWLAGIRAEQIKDGSPVVYKTIFNQTLEEAGYDQWSEQEPNNLYGNEYCGSIFTNDGKYNDINCNYAFAFICEKEITAKHN